jgi:uncharacterized protein (UPF0303 family)
MYICRFCFPQDGSTNDAATGKPGDEQVAEGLSGATDKANDRLKALIRNRQESNKENRDGFKVGERIKWKKSEKEWVEAVVVGTTTEQVYFVSKDDESVPEEIRFCKRKKSNLVKRCI